MMDQFRNQNEAFKDRWRDLVVRSTGDRRLADQIYKQMAQEELDARIDAQAGK